MASDHDHKLPLWGLFLALLALTAAEVALFEVWNGTKVVDAATGEITWAFMPKYAMVLLIFVFTIPKALIVLIYFMHLKFEKQMVVALAIAPFIFATIAVVPTLTDAMALRSRATNQDPALRTFGPAEDDHGHGDHEEKPEEPKPDPNDPFS